MTYFLDTEETIPPGMGFTLFGGEHLLWLFIMAAGLVINCWLYCRMRKEARETWRKTVAALIVADEIWKYVWLLIGGTFLPKYLPLHLCSINIFLVAIHAWKPSRLIGNFLYLVCLPGALAAMLFCSWAPLPTWNFMYLHSFTIHILLMMYPLVLTVAGDLRPQIRLFPKCVLLLGCMAVPVWLFNLAFDTNFMFLMYAEQGNPLLWFEENWGSHLWGYAVLLPLLLGLMSIPAWILSRRKVIPV